MPVPRPNSLLLRSLSVTAIALLSVGLSAGPGAAAPDTPAPPASRPAAPRTAAEALTQLRAFNHEFEGITEQYNDARVLLHKRQVEGKAAAARAASARADLVAVSAQLRHVVSTAYRTAPFSQFGALLSSGSPDEFIAQLSALDVVAGRRGRVVDRAGKARTAAAKAAQDAVAAIGAANAVTKELAVRRTDLQKRAAESKRQFDRLSAKERAAFLAAPEPVDRASRAAPRSAPVAPPVNVPASGRAAVAVATARAQLGKPYVWAAGGPNSFDCSGLTMYSWAAAGVSLPHSSRLQIGVGQQVSRSQLQPGDLVFFYSPISHVGIYVGGGQMIHAPTSGDVVRYASLENFPFAGASRPG